MVELNSFEKANDNKWKEHDINLRVRTRLMSVTKVCKFPFTPGNEATAQRVKDLLQHSLGMDSAEFLKNWPWIAKNAKNSLRGHWTTMTNRMKRRYLSELLWHCWWQCRRRLCQIQSLTFSAWGWFFQEGPHTVRLPLFRSQHHCFSQKQ